VAFIDANKGDVVEGRRLGVEPICRILQVAPSTYYAARDRPLSARARRDAELVPRLVWLWRSNYQVYGSRKLWKAARRAGIDIGRDQTRRLMAELGSRERCVQSVSEQRGGTPTPAGTRISSNVSSERAGRTSCG